MIELEYLREKYKEIFALKEPLKERPWKAIFDRCCSIIAMFFALPVFILIFCAYAIDSLIHSEHRGSLLISYYSCDRGKKFLKYKFRVSKSCLVDNNLREKCDQKAYPKEIPENLTCVGKILKKAYLDELPQLFNIAKGDMSFVGTRATSWEAYQALLRNGYVHKRVLKASLWSETDTRKGMPDFRNLDLEYGYIKKHMEFSAWRLFLVDLRIIARGLKQNIETKGY